MTTILAFDTETDGGFNAIYPEIKNSHLPIQIAWAIQRDNGKIEHKSYIIKNLAKGITEGALKVHNMNMVYIEKHGVNFDIIIDEFMSDIKRANVIIAHNFKFDYMVIRNALRHFNIPTLMYDYYMKKSHCTMKSTVDLCQLPKRYRDTGEPIKTKDGNIIFKYPKLVELHQHLFGYKTRNMHNASKDTAVTIKCYNELKRLGHV
jgi:DNA polymerase III epsilon subunit-like protein